MQVTLSTQCWEADWRRLLESNWLDVLARNNGFPFAQRVLMINNVQDYPAVSQAAQRAVQRGWIDRYIVVREHIDQALHFFQITPESFGKGYWFSSAELVGIFLCQTEFLLHFASDCIPPVRCDWIPKALACLNSDRRMKVANLTWNDLYAQAQAESLYETDDFYVGFGFSDQCFLVRAGDFRAPIYNGSHPLSARYPEYAGESFEKRVDSWMRNHRYLRATYKHGAYLHLTRDPSSAPPTG